MNQMSGLALAAAAVAASRLKPGGDDDVEVLVDERLDERRVVRVRGRDDDRRLGSTDGRGAELGADVGVLVEVLVVDGADVGDDADLQVRASAGSLAAGSLAAGSLAAGSLAAGSLAAGALDSAPVPHAATMMDRPANRASPLGRMRMCPPPRSGCRSAVTDCCPWVATARGCRIDPAGRPLARIVATAGVPRQASSAVRSARESHAPQPIILDCDPGHDDALAIALAVVRPELDVPRSRPSPATPASRRRPGTPVASWP